MKLSEIKTLLNKQSELRFQLPNGELVPENFHVTEVGKVTKHFMDCGGKERQEVGVNFQLWATDDFNHRLHPEKLLQIITLSERVLDLPDADIEVEYQGEDTISKFGLAYEGNSFLLTSKQTDCLAKDNCNIPEKKPLLKMANLPAAGACTPGGGCC